MSDFNQTQYGTTLPNSNLAIVSLVAAVLGFTLLPFIGSIVAVITGSMAKKEIEESAGTLGGAGLAQAGLIVGWVGIAVGVIGICVAGVIIAIPLCMGLFAFGSEGFSLILAPLALL